MKMLLSLSALAIVLISCSGGGDGNKLLPNGGGTPGPDPAPAESPVPAPPSKVVIGENDLPQWKRIRIGHQRLTELRYMDNYDDNKDSFIFCGSKEDGIHCAQYIFHIEKTWEDAWGNRRGTITSRELVEIPVPDEAKASKDITTKTSKEISGTDFVFCVTNSNKESCWFYDAVDFGNDGVMGCVDRDGKLDSAKYARIVRPGADWRACSGPFIEKDGFNYHFYGEKNFDGEETVRIERCTLDRRLDRSYGEEGSVFAEKSPPLKVARIDQVLKTDEGILLASADAFNQNGRVHMLDNKFNFSRKFTPAHINFNAERGTGLVLSGLKVNADRSLVPTFRFREGPHSYAEVTALVSSRGGDPQKVEVEHSIACMKYLY